MSGILLRNLSVHYYQSNPYNDECRALVYPNLSDISQIQRVKCSYEHFVNEVDRMLDYTCRNTINPDYVFDQMERAPMILLLYDALKTEKDGERIPLGFLVAFNDGYGEFYIDVICAAPGYGRYLLEFFMQDAVDNRGVRSIGLSALPHVLTYYPRFGFSHRRSCGEPGIGLPASITQRMATKSRLPGSVEESYDDDDFAAFMAELRDAGYGETEGVCSSRPLTKQALKSGSCGQNGYYMKYCAPQRAR